MPDHRIHPDKPRYFSMSHRVALQLTTIFLAGLLNACGGGGGGGGADSGVVSPNAGAAPNTATGTADAPALSPLTLGLQPVVTGLDSPLFLTAPTGDSRLFIVERPGRIRIVRDGTLLPAPFLDISSLTNVESENGLLSLAFHPQYATNRWFFVFYTDLDNNLVIERFTATDAAADTVEPLSALRILTIPSQNGVHNGGLLTFGPDGYLYIGIGDGANGGDPAGNAQNNDLLLGKMLRIDVNSSDAAQPYTIPPTNPFIGQENVRPEIWANGLRNPWRYSFDATTGLLYIADVGEGSREEINTVAGSLPGLNYGWNRFEGTLCSNEPCDRQGLTLPVLEYNNTSETGCSVTGGYVYRGTALPELQGRYFYSDFCGSWLKSFVSLNGTATEQKDWGIEVPGMVLSFGQDAQKELYILSINGTVYRMVRQ